MIPRRRSASPGALGCARGLGSRCWRHQPSGAAARTVSPGLAQWSCLSRGPRTHSSPICSAETSALFRPRMLHPAWMTGTPMAGGLLEVLAGGAMRCPASSGHHVGVLCRTARRPSCS